MLQILQQVMLFAGCLPDYFCFAPAIIRSAAPTDGRKVGMACFLSRPHSPKMATSVWQISAQAAARSRTPRTIQSCVVEAPAILQRLCAKRLLIPRTTSRSLTQPLDCGDVEDDHLHKANADS